MNREKLDLDNVDFFELLAHAGNAAKTKLIPQLIQLISQGDPAAIRLLEKAFTETKPKDEKNRPIPILGGITQQYKQNAIQSDNSAVQNSGAEKAA